MCQDSSTRRLRRSTVWRCLAADCSAKLHWVCSAASPSVEVDAIEITPQPYLPASVMPDGLIVEATATGEPVQLPETGGSSTPWTPIVLVGLGLVLLVVGSLVALRRPADIDNKD